MVSEGQLSLSLGCVHLCDGIVLCGLSFHMIAEALSHHQTYLATLAEERLFHVNPLQVPWQCSLVILDHVSIPGTAAVATRLELVPASS